ncbi:MAG: hypothetical protein ABEJ48_03290 [Halobacteriales archaeon]
MMDPIAFLKSRESWLTFESRLVRHDLREWIVLTGDRLLVSLLGFIILGIVFVSIVFSGLVPLQKETPVLFLLFALIGANFTLIAIVTSLSQFALSRHLESPGEIRDKMEATLAYREDVGETIRQNVMPINPDTFFLALYHNVNDELDVLDTFQSQGRTKQAREELAELITGLQLHTDYVIDVLHHPASGMKHALFTSLTTDYENFVHRTWYLQSEHADEFTDRAAEPLTRLAETLEHIEVASRMFKTAFIESEVSELSRFLLYVGLPVQLLAVIVMLLYSAPGSEPPVSVSLLKVLIPAVLTAGFTPFLILSSYVIRLTVVARRTAENFPFSSRLEGSVAMGDEFSRNL